jgi:hypothetical protein
MSDEVQRVPPRNVSEQLVEAKNVFRISGSGINFVQVSVTERREKFPQRFSPGTTTSQHTLVVGAANRAGVCPKW